MWMAKENIWVVLLTRVARCYITVTEATTQEINEAPLALGGSHIQRD